MSPRLREESVEMVRRPGRWVVQLEEEVEEGLADDADASPSVGRGGVEPWRLEGSTAFKMRNVYDLIGDKPPYLFQHFLMTMLPQRRWSWS